MKRWSEWGVDVVGKGQWVWCVVSVMRWLLRAKVKGGRAEGVRVECAGGVCG